MHAYRTLAQSVLLRAFEDAVAAPIADPKRDAQRQKDRIDGREFLTTRTDDLEFWCRALSIHPNVIIAGAQRLAANGWTRPDTRPIKEEAHDDGF